MYVAPVLAGGIAWQRSRRAGAALAVTGFVLTLQAEALLACDRPTEAVEVLQEGRRLALRLANPVGEADVLEVLARCQDLLGRASEARSCRAQAAELWSMMGSTRGAALGLTESCA